MSKTGGGSWVCLVLLGVSACSSPSAPPAEGSAQVNFSGCTFPQQTISGPGGIPSGAKVGPNQTVLDGRDGYIVTCSVIRSGASYSVSGSIQGPDFSLTVDANGVTTSSGTATMSFFTTQTINTYTSPNTSLCSLTTTSSTTGYTIMPGSIWAHYDCPTAIDQNNLSNPCHTQGYIVFTGCNK